MGSAPSGEGVDEASALGGGGAADDGTGGVFSPRFLPVTIAILVTISLAAFDALAIVAALPEIGADLGSVGLLPWVLTGFLVTSTIAVVVAGPVIDAFGVRATFRATLVAFVAASLACAAAPNLPLLVAARVVQGLGGGLVVAVCFAAVGVAYPGRLTARAFAAESTVWGIAGFGGPAVASVLVSTFGWQAVFLVNLPLGLAAAAAGWRAFPERVAGARELRLDRRGVVLLALFVVVSLVGIGQLRWWSVPAIAGAAALAVAYWRHSGSHPEPVLSRRHVAGPAYARFNLAAFVVLATGLGADTYLPLYLRAARGTSTSFAAFAVLWLTVGWTAGSIATGLALDRVGAGRLVATGFALQLTGLVANAGVVAVDGPVPVIFAGFSIVGLGVGLVTSTVLTQVQRGTDPAEMGRANAAHQFCRNLGITFGIAVGGAALLGLVGSRVDDLDAVRELLAGDDEVEVDADTGEAVADGFVAALLVGAGGMGVGGLAMARGRRRQRTAAAAR